MTGSLSTSSASTSGHPAPAADLDAAAIAAALRGERLGTVIDVRSAVPSTMDAAFAVAAGGAPEGAVVLAEAQTAGRGRHGRPWTAPPGTALMLSIVLRPAVDPSRLHQAVMAVALGAFDAAAARLPAGAPLGLKWPNDLTVGGAKLAGLLAETFWPGVEPGVGSGVGPGDGSSDGRPLVIVGLGLNVDQTADALPDGATSLRLAEATALDRNALAIDVLRAAGGHYADVLAGVDIVPRWAQRLATLGADVTVRDAVSGAVVVVGRATGVTGDGALVVTGADGGVTVVRAGDVTLRGN